MLHPTLRVCLTLILACLFATGCKSPICRVGKENGKAEMKAWMGIGSQPVGWLQSWQRFEDYRHKKIYLHEPDMSLLCDTGCEEARKKLQRAIETRLFQGLRAEAQYEWVADRSQAEFEIHLKIAQVKEHHYIEHVSVLPPSDFYICWFKVTNTQTSATAFWAKGFGLFTDIELPRTFPPLLSQFNNFKDWRG